MRRNGGRHPDRNAVRAVNEDIREARRQNLRFALRLIEVGHEIHNVLVKVAKEHILSEFFQPGLGITHRGSPVPLDGTEIAVPVHQDAALLEFLGHHHQSVINGAVPMGMVFAHRVANDTRTFPVRPVVARSQLPHVKKNPSLHGLQPVPDIRQRSRHDDRHRVIYIVFLHDFGVIRADYPFF